MVRRQARRVPDRREADGRGLLRLVQARPDRLRDQRSGPSSRRRRRGSPRRSWRRAPRARSRSRTTTSSARRSSWSPVWTRSRRCRSCTCACARPRRRGAKIYVLHPRRTRLWDVAEHILCRPGEEQDVVLRRRPDIDEAFRAAGADGVMLAGPRLADGGTQRVEHRRARRADRSSVRIRHPPGERSRGARARACIRRSCRAAGGSRVADERTEVENLWGPIIVGDEGRNWWGIMQACADRDVDVLFLVGVDPLRDFPDAALVTRALQNVDRLVVQSLELGSLEPFADAFLPAAAFLEKDGHVTTWEGREPADPADPRRGRHRAPGLGDLREPGAGRGRRPGLRDAR